MSNDDGTYLDNWYYNMMAEIEQSLLNKFPITTEQMFTGLNSSK